MASVLAVFTPLAGSCPHEKGRSGIVGTVMKGPMCPGPGRIGHPCPDKPVAATFYVHNAEGKVVATFRSDDRGHFEVELLPGTYTLVPDEEARAETVGAVSVRVTVKEGEVTEVPIHWDTGMR